MAEGRFDQSYYAEHADELGWGEHTAPLDPERSAYLREFTVGPKVLDVGCATGVYVDMICRHGLAGTGVDFTPEFIRVAKRKHKGDYVVGNAYKLPFKAKTFDTVWLLDILEHLDDVKVLHEAKRVTKQRIIIAVPCTPARELEDSGLIHRGYSDLSHLRYYDEAMMRALAKAAEAKIITLQPVAPVDFKGLIRHTVDYGHPLLNKILMKALFGSFKVAKLKAYYSEWLLVLEI